MTTENPYKAPLSAISQTLSNECRREGKHVFVPAGYDLPPRCIVCNAAVDGPIKQRTMYWHTPWLYLLILLNIVIYGLFALIVRKKVKVSPGYCQAHSAARRRKMMLFMMPSALLMLGGIFIMLRGDTSVGTLVLVPGVLLLLPASIVSSTIRPVRIDKSGTKFAGCKEPFLSSLFTPPKAS